MAEISDKKANFTRLSRLMFDEGTKALRNVLDKIHPPASLAAELKRVEPLLEKELRKRKRILNDAQWDLLYPKSGDTPKSTNFDITLLLVLLRNGSLCAFTPPKPNGWDKLPEDGDNSDEANIARIKFYRNQICHITAAEIETSEFESLWPKIAESVIALGIDRSEIDKLKTVPIDPSVIHQMEEWKKEVQREIEETQGSLEELQNQMEEVKLGLHNAEQVKERVDDLESDVQVMNRRVEILESGHEQACDSRLPDPLTHIIGRSEEIKQIADLLKADDVAAVLVTGGPGYGKTAVANRVAHELKNNMVAKFCSLRGFTSSFIDLLREISFNCSGEMGKQIEDDPEKARYMLLGWCSRLDTKLVLWLDDADDVIQGVLKQKFIKLLSDMRKDSKCRIKFLITSRTKFASTDLPSVEAKQIGCLNTEDSVEVIRQSLAAFEECPGNEKEQNEPDELKRIAKLCDYAPLALRISGALLSDYSIDELIEKVKTKPMETLYDVGSDQSMKNAIKASFDKLDENHKRSLVLLSVFVGPFDKEAAKALLGENCEPTLRLLKLRCLLERRTGKYVLHSLIQSFARQVGKQDYEQQCEEAEQKYFDHFLSVLGGHSRRFWSKDGCKESLTLFNADRIHLEHVIKVFSKRYKKSSQSVRSVLNDAEDIFSYVQMCISPNLFEQFLLSVLNFGEEHSDESDKVLRVIVLCKLGDEMRKRGKNHEYSEYMKRAKTEKDKCSEQFKSKKTTKTELYYLNSYIRYLENEKLDTQEAEMSLSATYEAQRKHVSNPSLALSLVQSLDEFGMRLRKMNKYDEARKTFIESLDIKKKCLGVHVFTAYSLKDLADLELNQGNDHKKALDYYEQSMKMLSKLGMSEEKEAIKILKNFGVCLRDLERFDEAVEKLQLASAIAERKIKGDDRLKVIVKSEEAVLCRMMNRMDKAKTVAKEAINMAKRCNLKQWPRGSEVYAILKGKWMKRK